MTPASPAIIEALQASVKAHLTAIEVYSMQAVHFLRWGYHRLSEAAKQDSDDEREHLNRLIERLEDFDTAPDMAHSPAEWPRHDLNGILSANLALEKSAAEIERAGILTARESGDETTAHAFAKNLRGSEEGITTIEAAQKVISQVGLDNYLANHA